VLSGTGDYMCGDSGKISLGKYKSVKPEAPMSIVNGQSHNMLQVNNFHIKILNKNLWQ